jgi:hypothetical protein
MEITKGNRNGPYIQKSTYIVLINLVQLHVLFTTTSLQPTGNPRDGD